MARIVASYLLSSVYLFNKLPPISSPPQRNNIQHVCCDPLSVLTVRITSVLHHTDNWQTARPIRGCSHSLSTWRLPIGARAPRRRSARPGKLRTVVKYREFREQTSMRLGFSSNAVLIQKRASCIPGRQLTNDKHHTIRLQTEQPILRQALFPPPLANVVHILVAAGKAPQQFKVVM